jgi:hypothetical protein
MLIALFIADLVKDSGVIPASAELTHRPQLDLVD